MSSYYQKHKRAPLVCLSVSILAVACAAVRTHTVTDIDRIIRPDGTIEERIHSETTTTSDPVGGTITVNAAGVGGSVSITPANGEGGTTETEVPEGEQAEIPEDTESVTTETETTQPCPICGEVQELESVHSSQSSGSSSIPFHYQHRSHPYEFRTEYRGWPNPLLDVSACVSVKGHPSTSRRAVEARSEEIGNYFRQGQMGLTSNGVPTGAPLPSFSNVDVLVREIMFFEPTATGANFHYYDTLPFEWLEFTLNGTDYSLQTPGATNGAAPSGWYHAVIPVPASAFQLYSTYASTIKRQGSNQLGGRSMVVEFKTP